MKERKKISFYKSGNGQAARINLSIPALRKMNINSENKDISIFYSENEIIIKKEKAMEKRGLEWYKAEMINEERKYSFKHLYKMIESEFKIPIVISKWIEKDENLEVYKVYRELRDLIPQEEDEMRFFNLVKLNLPRKDMEQHLFGAILGQFTGEVKVMLDFEFNFKIDELLNMSTKELQELKKLLNNEDLSKYYALRTLKKEINNFNDELNAENFTRLLYDLTEKLMQTFNKIISKERKEIKLIDLLEKLDKQEEVITKVVCQSKEINFTLGKERQVLNIVYEDNVLTLYNTENYIRLQLTDELLQAKVHKMKKDLNFGVIKNTGYLAEVPNQMRLIFYIDIEDCSYSTVI